MLNWYDMPGALNDFECNPAYLEKLEIDEECEAAHRTIFDRKPSASSSACSWLKKRSYKKKMVRRFLSINPDMDYSKFYGTRCGGGIYLCIPSYNNGAFYDPKMDYDFNPYTRIYLSRRGDLRKYHGAAFPCRIGYALGAKDKYTTKITNRRIRCHAIDEEATQSYSYYKKLYGPLVDEIW